MDRTGLELNLSFVSLQHKNSSHCHLDIIHGSGASPLRLPVYCDHRSAKTLRDCERVQSAMERAYFWNCVGRCSQSHSDENYGECVVAMHVPPINGIAQVKFKVLDETEPTLSMPMLLANSNRVVLRGEDAMLFTAEGETAPLTSDGDDRYLKVLINNENVFIRIDVWAACHECPPNWVRCLSPENVERRTTPESTTITKTRKGFEVKNSSSPEQTGAAGNPRNTQLLEDVDELMPAKPWCNHAESATSPLGEKDIAAVHGVFGAQNFCLLLSRDEEMEALRSLSS